MPIRATLKPWGVLVILGVFLGSCAPQAQRPQEQQTAQEVTQPEPELTIVTTFLPITAFTKAVAGDRAKVEQLLPPNGEVHDFQARPEDVQRLSSARVLVKNGLGMETFLDKLIENAANPDLKIIDTSAGVATIASEQHDHDHQSDHAHDPGGHSHGKFNPHIWLDPKRAIQQVKNIRDGLIAVDPDGATVYEKNSVAFIGKLQALDALAREKLAPFAGKTFVVYHDVAPYFAESYNLKATYLVGIPSVNPSPADVKRVMQAVQQSDLKTLLTEPGQEQVFESLAKDLGVRVSVFDPLERAPSAADLTPAYFLQTMEQNIRNLAEAFGAQQRAYRRPDSIAVVGSWMRVNAPVGAAL
ncbi:metal ABC transporter substrate-binding protein [uncultured Thermosynechococcus sp.]|uniref:metal ABC transporter substrate-binding protein n=1 Tax=uncultured Thermosynechococcus sp. TaxID=436945 RepID=UPI002637DFC0|nr:metal ABC transporter substrate-binding protein [uncultured Thermosynechococcus sp.]